MNNPINNIKENQNRIYYKGGAIVAIALLLMLPNAFIQNLIHERQSLQFQVTSEVSESWGNAQTITGPILKIPFDQYHEDEEGKRFSRRDVYVVMPRDLNLKSSLVTTTRTRSIYDVNLYTSNVDATGRFIMPPEILERNEDKVVLWEEAEIVIGVTDVTALKGAPEFKFDNVTYKISPGAKLYSQIRSGFSVNEIRIDPEKTQYDFGLSFVINGSKSFTVNPIAQRTNIEVASDWASPSFYGSFLPRDHNITEDGFVANWEVSEFNRNFPNFWVNNLHDLSQNMASVKFVDPVNDYHKNIRTAKYAILIIGLSFLLFFFIELLSGMRIHPIQYVLVGIALTVFYTLLISFTEHIGFDLAYILSCSATIGLIAVYCYSIIEKKKQVISMITALVFLYLYIYIILQLEDYALIVGSIGLFAILAGVMIYTRKVNFYQIGNRD